MDAENRIKKALEYAYSSAQIDGAHHKAWTIDQMVRALTGCPIEIKEALDVNKTRYSYEAQTESEEYLEFVRDYKNGDDGPETYGWDEGIAP